MRIITRVLTLIFAMLPIFILIPQSFSDDGILIGHGDHFEMVCRDDGLVDFVHVILVSANITQNVTCEATYSFDGTLDGNVSYEYDREIYRHEVLSRSENGTSTIFVNFSATLELREITRLKMKYTVKDLLKEVNGTWQFKYAINAHSTSPPEVLLKIPKPPTQFHKLVIENIVPAPHVFIEESHYFVLVWKSALFTFGDTSTTYIDVRYKTVLNVESVGLWVILILIGAVMTEISRKIWKKWLAPRKNTEQKPKQ